MITFTHTEVEGILKVAKDTMDKQLMRAMMDTADPLKQAAFKMSMDFIDKTLEAMQKEFDAMATEQIGKQVKERFIAMQERGAIASLRPVCPDVIIVDEDGIAILDIKTHNNPEVD